MASSPHWAAAQRGEPAIQKPAADVGTPEAAFSGGPIKLSKAAVELLRMHFQGNQVPLIPQPFRGKLDTALAAHDWARVEVAKRELIAAKGVVTALAWQQSRFIATGGIGVAEQHALDLAATGSTGVTETAAMLWLYSVAVTLTDGHKCVDPAVKEAHLDRLWGPEFEPTARIIRALPEERVAAMRELAIWLETRLAVDRTDDTMCRTGATAAEVKPDAVWRKEAATARRLLMKQLTAIAAVLRAGPAGGAVPARPDAKKPEPAAKPEPHAAPAQPPAPVESVIPAQPMTSAQPAAKPMEPAVTPGAVSESKPEPGPVAAAPDVRPAAGPEIKP